MRAETRRQLFGRTAGSLSWNCGGMTALAIWPMDASKAGMPRDSSNCWMLPSLTSMLSAISGTAPISFGLFQSSGLSVLSSCE